MALAFVLAGHAVPAAPVAWMFWLLARRPRCRELLRAELTDVLGDALPSAASLPDLVYTEAVVKEALRLYPPTWLVSREVVEDCELGGYSLRRGQMLLLSSYVSGRDPRFFPSPDDFVPERWLDPEVPAVPRGAYFPFGGGDRICLGYGLAMQEMQLMLATLEQRLDIEVPAPERARLDYRRGLVPAGLGVRVQRRARLAALAG